MRYELRPLRVWAFEALMACWERPAGEAAGRDDPAAAAPARGARLMEAAGRVFPDHVRNVEGLSVRAEGQSLPATLEQICGETAFLPLLAGEMLSRLLSISDLTEEEEKN